MYQLRKFTHNIKFYILLLLSSLFLASCGNNSSGGGNSSVAIDVGQFNADTVGATCTLFDKDSKQIGDAFTTGSDGTQSGSRSNIPAGIVTLECVSGTYKDEATGATVTLSTTNITRAVQNYDGTSALKIYASAISDVAHKRAFSHQTITTTIVDDQNRITPLLFGITGVTDISKVEPTDINKEQPTTNSTGKVGVILALISDVVGNDAATIPSRVNSLAAQVNTTRTFSQRIGQSITTFTATTNTNPAAVNIRGVAGSTADIVSNITNLTISTTIPGLSTAPSITTNTPVASVYLNDTISAITFTNANAATGKIAVCDISPDITVDTGLSFNHSNCSISGVATKVAAKDYTITAVNSIGVSSAVVNITTKKYTASIAVTQLGGEIQPEPSVRDTIFSISLDKINTSGNPISGNVVYSGTAIDGQDYVEPTNTSFSIPNNQSTVTINIPSLNDTISDSKSLVASLVLNTSSLAYAQIHNTNGTITATLLDNDSPSVSFSDVNTNIQLEGLANNAFDIPITLSQAHATNNTVITYTVGGTANNPADHNLATGTFTITIPAGATTTPTPISFTVVGDTIAENDETIIITLTGVTNGETGDAAAVLGTSKIYTHTIKNDDIATVSFAKATSATDPEPGRVNTLNEIHVNLSTVADFDVTVGYAIDAANTTASPSDYISLKNSVVIPAGTTTAFLELFGVGDFIIESDEIITLNLTTLTASNPSAVILSTTANTHKHTLVNNDFASLSFAKATSKADEGNSGTTSVNIPVNLREFDELTGSKLTTRPTDITINYVVNSSSSADSTDYTTPAGFGTLTIPTGATTATISFTVNGDTTAESNETIILNITNITGDFGTKLDATKIIHTYTIDSDDAPAVGFASSGNSVNEGAVTATTIPVNLSQAHTANATTITYTVSGTADSIDYNTPTGFGTLVIPANNTTANINFNVVENNIAENDETIIITLTNVNNGETGDAAAVLGTKQYIHTIKNDDTATISFTVATSANSESITPNQSIRVNLSLTADFDITVAYAIDSNSTAKSPSDYTTPAGFGTLTVPAGNTTANINFTVVDDTVIEVDESVILDIASVSGANNSTAAVLGTTKTYTHTITNDDFAFVNFFKDLSSNDEGNSGTTLVNIPVSLLPARTTDITISYIVNSNSTADSTDYSTPAGFGTLTVPAGNTTANINFTVNGDTTVESNENIILDINDITGDFGTRRGVTTRHIYTITSDDSPVVGFASSGNSVDEGAATATTNIPVSLSQANTTNATTITYTVSGTANSPADHNLAGGTLVIPANATSADISFSVVGDTIAENNENIIITLTAVDNGETGVAAAVLGTKQYTHTITNDDTATVSFAATTSSSLENANPNQSIPINLSTVVDFDVTVKYVVDSNSTAQSPNDYTTSAGFGTLTIPAGSTTANLNFSVVGDTAIESDETVILSLTSVSGSNNSNATTVSATVKHTYTITNDDFAFLSFAKASSSNIEGNSGTTLVTVPLNLTLARSADITITYGVNSSSSADSTDYTTPAGFGTLTIPANATTANISFSVVGDTTVESHETIILNITNITGDSGVRLSATNATHTYTIDSDDSPAVGFASSGNSVDEGTVTTTTIPVNLSQVHTTKATTITYTVSGTANNPADHNLAGGTLVIPANATSADISFSVVGDTIAENNETIIITLTAVDNGETGATAAVLGSNQEYTHTITNDDTATVSFAAATSTSLENANPNQSIPINLSTVVDFDVTVKYVVDSNSTAQSPNDYTTSAGFGTLTIPAGSTTANLNFSVVGDTAIESDETVILSLTSVSGSNNSNATTVSATVKHTYTIENDDFAFLSFASASARADEGNSGTTLVTVPLNLTLARSADITINYGVNSSSSASNPADYTTLAGFGKLTIPAGATTANISFSVIGDTIAESNETIILNITSITGDSDQIRPGTHATYTYTITSDDSSSVSFADSGASVDEGATTVTTNIPVNLSQVHATNDTVINYTVSGTADDLADHTLVSGALTIPAGSTSANLSFSIIGDAIAEDDETIIITLTRVNNGETGVTAAVLGTNQKYTYTIKNDDTATVSFAAVSKADEGDTANSPQSVGVNLSTAVDFDVTVIYDINTSNSSAQSTSDYTTPTTGFGTLTIPANATTANINFTVLGDTVIENDETIIFNITSVSGSNNPTATTVSATAKTHTYTITNDDFAFVNFASASSSNNEGNFGFNTKTISVVTLSEARPVDMTINYNVDPSSTADSTDYVISANFGKITIPAGNTTANIEVSINGDGSAEPDETIILNITGVTGDSGTKPGTTIIKHTYTIKSDDGPTVNFASIRGNADEGTSTVTATTNIPVNISQANATNATTITYTVSGTANSPADHDLVDGTVTIPAGATTANISFSVVGDTIAESDETIIVTLTSVDNGDTGATGAVFGTNKLHTHTINNDDFATVSFATPTSGGLEGRSVAVPKVTINLSSAADFDIFVTYAADAANTTATKGTDYNTSFGFGSLTIPAGATTADISFSVFGDLAIESDETVAFIMTNVSSNNPAATKFSVARAHTYTIINDDFAFLSFASASSKADEGNSGTTLVNIPINLTAARPADITITYGVNSSSSANNPADYTTLASFGSLTIPTGNTTANISFSVIGDTIAESNETIILNITGITDSGVRLGTANATHTYTITSDDSSAVGFASSGASVNEGAVTATTDIPITISQAHATNATTITYTVSGTATNPADHTLAGGTVTIPANATTANISFDVIGNTTPENDETIIITLTTVNNGETGAAAAVLGTKQYTHTITNDDTATVSFAAASSGAVEGNTANSAQSIGVSLSKATDFDVIVKYVVDSNSTAQSPSDYTTSAGFGTFTISAGATSANINFSVVGDTAIESDETVILNITSVSGANNSNAVTTVSATVKHTYTITNDDFAFLSFASASSSGNEGNSGANTLVNIPVNLTAARPADITIDYVVNPSSTANNPADYTTLSGFGKLTIPAGATTANISFTVKGDATTEPNETIILNITSITDSSVRRDPAKATHTYTITSDDGPTVSFASSGASANEGAVTATTDIPVNLSQAHATKATVITYTVSGTANNPADHTLAGGTVTIPANATTANISFSVVGDAVIESDETIIITLTTVNNGETGAAAAVLGTNKQYTHTITNDDFATVAFATPAIARGENGNPNHTIPINLSTAVNFDVTVKYNVNTSHSTAQSPSDYTTPPGFGTLTIPAGATTANISFTVVGDDDIENDETIVFNITSVSSSTNAAILGAATHTFTITNDNFAFVNFASASSKDDEGNSGTTLVNIPINLTVARPVDITINYNVDPSGTTATNPADHNLVDGTVTIPAGATTANISFSVVADTIAEVDETIILNITGVTGDSATKPGTAPATAITKHTYTIGNDDRPQVNFASIRANADEGTSTVTATTNIPVNISLAHATNPTTITYTVSGTANSPADHNLVDGTVTIPAGATTANISFSVVGDTIAESDETIIVTLTSVDNGDTGATGAVFGTNKLHTHTINNDDFATVSFATPTSGGLEGRSVAVPKVTINLSSAADFDIFVTYAADAANTTATKGTDYNTSFGFGSLTIPAGATTADISFSVFGDLAIESDETVAFIMTNVSSNNPAATKFSVARAHTYTIINDDFAFLSFASASSKADEGNSGTTLVNIPINLTAARPADITITYGVNSSSSANNPADYTTLASFGSLTIPTGNTTANISFSVKGDLVSEPNETIILNITGITDSGVRLGTANATHTYTITSDDGPIIGFASSGGSVNEGAVTATTDIPITISQAHATNATTITYTVSGTATNPADHTLAGGTVTIPANATTANISFDVIGNTTPENDETIIITLTTVNNGETGAAAAVLGTKQYTHTITNDDTATVSFAAASSGAVEGNTANSAQSIGVSLSKATDFDVIVKYVVDSNSTAQSPSDYTTSAGFGTLTIPANATTANISFSVVGDTIAEDGETVILNITSVSGANNSTAAILSTTAKAHTYTITNDDAPIVSFASSGASVNEGTVTATVNIPVNLSLAHATKATVITYTVSGTANNPADHTLAGGTVTIPANATTANISFDVVGDTILESDETIIITLTAVNNGETGVTAPVLGTKQYTHTIKNDDAAAIPFVSFATSGVSVVERPKLESIAVNLSTAVSFDVLVGLTVDPSSTALRVGDYSTIQSPLRIPAGATTANIRFLLQGDDDIEDDETIIIKLTSLTPDTPSAVRLGTTNQTHIYTIKNDDFGFVNFGSASARAGEGNSGTKLVTVPISVTPSRDVVVTYAVHSSSTADSTDYTTPAGFGKATITATTANINFTINGDTTPEPNETIVLSITDIKDILTSSVVPGAIATYTYTIDNDDRFPTTVGFASNTGSTDESDNSGMPTVGIPVNLSQVHATNTTTITYTVSGTATNPADHNLVGGTLVIPAGSTTANIDFTIYSSDIAESDETIIITLTSVDDGETGITTPVLGTKQHTHTITDNFVLARFVDIDSFHLEGSNGNTTASLKVQVHPASTHALAINYLIDAASTADSADYSTPTTGFGTLSIPAGSTSGDITLFINGDSVVENIETIIVKLFGATADPNVRFGTTKTHTINIVDDDSPVKLVASGEYITGVGVTYTGTISTSAGDIGQCTSSPALPTGFSITASSNAKSCVISGKSAIVSPKRQYTITATNRNVNPTAPFDQIDITFGVIDSFVNTVYLAKTTTKYPLISGKTINNAPVKIELDTNNSPASSEVVYDTNAASNGEWSIDINTANKTSGTLKDFSTYSANDIITFKVTVSAFGITNVVTKTTTVSKQPLYSISNSEVTEGITGANKTAVFSIFRESGSTLSSGNGEQVTYTVNTATSIAIFSSFFTDVLNPVATGTVDFSDGEALKTISFNVRGDYLKENDETIVVTISSPVGGTINRATGVATLKERDLSQMMGMYSLRDLNPDKDTHAVRVRRGSDDTEQDIGFTDGGSFDTTSLLNFVGTHTGYVTTWYDQSYNTPVALVQADPLKQGVIAHNSKVIAMVDGNPAIEFGEGKGADGIDIRTTLANSGYMHSQGTHTSATVQNLEIYFTHEIQIVNNTFPSVVSLSGRSNVEGKKMLTIFGRSDFNRWYLGHVGTSSKDTVTKSGGLYHPLAPKHVAITANLNYLTSGTAGKNHIDAKQAIFFNGIAQEVSAVSESTSAPVNEEWLLMADGRNFVPVLGGVGSTGHGRINEFVVYAGNTIHEYNAPYIRGSDVDDVFTYAGENYQRIEGGLGYDMLYVQTSSAVISITDGTTTSSDTKIIEMERIDAKNTQSNDIRILSDRVIDSAQRDTLEIHMDSTDKLTLPSGYATDGANHTYNGVSYKLYTKGNLKVYVIGTTNITAP